MLRAAIAGLIVAAALAGAPAALADSSVASGPLSAKVSSDPWRLTFTDGSGRPILSESTGRGSGPTGSLGFQTAAGWFHATGVASETAGGGAYEAELETTDPAGRRIAVTIAPDLDGVIRVSAHVVGGPDADVTAVGIGFDAPAAERYLGFGERSNAVDQRGNEVENYVSDGPYQEEERPFFNAFIPPAGWHPRDDATYFPMPWLLSTAGYGVLIENTETSWFRLATDSPDGWSMEANAKQLAFRVFAGPTPAGAVRRLTEFTGRQPKPAAPWLFGPWYQPVADDKPAEAGTLRDADVPSSAVNTYTHYLPCGAQVGATAEQRDLTRRFHALGYAITTYFNPMICNTYQPVFDDAVAAHVLTMDALGQPYVYRYTSGVGLDREFRVGQFDFSAPGADAFYGGLLDEAVGDGYDGWMEDFGEYTPLDSRSANGMGGERMHNLYPVLYHRSSRRYARTSERPVAGFIRSGWTGVQPYAQLVWGGDPSTDWGFDGLQSAMYQGLTMGMSGISRWGSDIGGFFALGTRNRTTEMLIRWIEFGAVSGVMRTEKNGVSLPPKSRPQITDPDVLPIWRRYAKLRTQLYPYIQAADAAYRRSGLPIMRHMALSYPDSAAAVARDDQFMFGPDLLAAPVVEPGASNRSLYLPPGRWIDLGEALEYRRHKGGFRLGAAAALPGGTEVTVDAPLEQLPLLARSGSVIATLPPSVDTLAGYGSRKRTGVVGLADRDHRLRLLAFPRGDSRSRFGLDGVIDSREQPAAWTLTVRGPQATRYHLQASLRTLRGRLFPCRLELNGMPLEQRHWSYRAASGVLRATVHPRGRRLTLRVSGGLCNTSGG